MDKWRKKCMHYVQWTVCCTNAFIWFDCSCYRYAPRSFMWNEFNIPTICSAMKSAAFAVRYLHTHTHTHGMHSTYHLVRFKKVIAWLLLLFVFFTNICLVKPCGKRAFTIFPVRNGDRRNSIATYFFQEWRSRSMSRQYILTNWFESKKISIN